MAKFIQICASQDDLFALDEEGEVYQYNFNTEAWVRLVPSRSHEGVSLTSGMSGGPRRTDMRAGRS